MSSYSCLFWIVRVVAFVPCKWIQPTSNDWRNVWQALKIVAKKREYKLRPVFEAASKLVLFLFYVLHFAFSLAQLLSDLQHLVFGIICLVVSFTGFTKNTVEIICLWRQHCWRTVAIHPTDEPAAGNAVVIQPSDELAGNTVATNPTDELARNPVSIKSSDELAGNTVVIQPSNELARNPVSVQPSDELAENTVIHPTDETTGNPVSILPSKWTASNTVAIKPSDELAMNTVAVNPPGEITRNTVAGYPSDALSGNTEGNNSVETHHEIPSVQSTDNFIEFLKNALEENLVLYPAIVCSIVRFAHGEDDDFKSGWSDNSTVFLLCCGILIDMVFFKVKRGILVYRYWDALCKDYERLKPNNCCDRVFGVLPRFAFHLLTMPFCQWLNLLILGYRLRFEHRTLHLNYALTWRSAYMIGAGIIVPFLSAVVLFLLNQAWVIGIALEILAKETGHVFVSATMTNIANTACFKKFYGGFWNIISAIILASWSFSCHMYLTCVYSLFPFGSYGSLFTFGSQGSVFLLTLIACFCVSNIHALISTSITQVVLEILFVYAYLALIAWFTFICCHFCIEVICEAICKTDE